VKRRGRRALVFVAAVVAACASFRSSDEGGDAGLDGGGGEGGPGGGDGGDGAEAGLRSCPGASGMVSIDVPGGGSYRIDATEITTGAYQDFLTATNGDMSGQPPGCGWNMTYKPGTQWPPTDPRLPVQAIDWCDAFMYCKWKGKRLCGAIGGGPCAVGCSNDGGADQWFRACSHGDDGAHVYGYGNDRDAGVCNICSDAGPFGVADVGSFSRCTGGYDGLFDMVGNVLEWVDGCNGDAGAFDGGADDRCPVRSSSSATCPPFACTALAGPFKRNTHDSNFGARCCCD
jgi:formylglycine-generating enzyme required for sulfatase activity